MVINTPVSHGVELDAEGIYVLPRDDPQARSMPVGPRGALDPAMHEPTVRVGARLQADLARHAKSVDLIVLPAASPHYVQPIDFDQSKRLIGQVVLVAACAAQAQALSPNPWPGEPG